MNADAIRHFYNYHFAENRKTWDWYIVPLSQELFIKPVEYSMGSVRNQLVHLINCDEIWFKGLRGMEITEDLNPDDFESKESIRAYWDKLEQEMRDYLGSLRDEDLFTKPLEGADARLFVWQVLLHVVNHATDHRAQILRLLCDLGVKTGPQDYIFYIFDNP